MKPMKWDGFFEQRIARGDDFYPTRLNKSWDPPFLRLLGSLDFRAKKVAIVGTRNADSEAVMQARQLGYDFAARGWTVVSGGARGIDIAAHNGALEARGKTIVVLPSGFRNAYPRAHQPTYKKILQSGGALISELEDDVLQTRAHFAKRNRTIAAFADAVVVVQAPLGSGALITANEARRMGVPVFAVPAAPWDLRGLGFQELLRQGAQICNSAVEVLKGNDPVRQVSRRHRQKVNEDQESFQGFAESEREVLQALSNRPLHPDELSAHTGIGAAELQRTILKLQMQGHIESRAGGKYCRTLPGFALRHEEVDEQSSPNR